MCSHTFLSLCCSCMHGSCSCMHVAAACKLRSVVVCQGCWHFAPRHTPGVFKHGSRGLCLLSSYTFMHGCIISGSFHSPRICRVWGFTTAGQPPCLPSFFHQAAEHAALSNIASSCYSLANCSSCCIAKLSKHKHAPPLNFQSFVCHDVTGRGAS
jgi:hypothetical protein